MSETDRPSSPIADRSWVRRAPQRGAYDRETVHTLLDAGMLAHIGNTIDAPGRLLADVLSEAYERWSAR